MAYAASHPTLVCRATNGVTVSSVGLVTSSADNQTGSQAPAVLATGINYTVPFEVRGPIPYLIIRWTPGTATDLQLGVQIFGSDVKLADGATYAINSSNQATSASSPQIISGYAYSLVQPTDLSAWATPSFGAAAKTCWFPIVAQVAAGLGSGFQAGIVGRYMRLFLAVTGAVSNATLVNIEVAFQENV